MIRLRITPDGRIRGLWTDAVDFIGIGRTAVRRASHVEFDAQSQQWTVREANRTRKPQRANPSDARKGAKKRVIAAEPSGRRGDTQEFWNNAILS